MVEAATFVEEEVVMIDPKEDVADEPGPIKSCMKLECELAWLAVELPGWNMPAVGDMEDKDGG